MLKYKSKIAIALCTLINAPTHASNPNFLSDSPFTPINGPMKESDLLTTVGTHDSQVLKLIDGNRTFTTPLAKPKKRIVTPAPTEQQKKLMELQDQIEELKTKLNDAKATHKKEKSQLHTTISWLTDINATLRNKVIDLRISENEKDEKIGKLEQEIAVMRLIQNGQEK